jgi:hypothetical protein
MWNFIYRFLFIDQKTSELSHTKFWSNIGYGIMCWSFVYVVWVGKTEINYELWLLFGVVVIGNRTLKTVLLKGKE